MTGRIPGPRVPGDLTAAQYAALAHSRHLHDCPTCRNSELCPRGQRYADAANTSNDDIPGLAGI